MTSLYGALDGNKSGEHDETKLTISVGRVMDTNDPQQMGRVRVYVPGLDRSTIEVGDLPFAIYCSPFAGHQQIQSRGPEDDTYSTGPVAYGMFNIPKVGTDVIVAHLNGDPAYRIWFGALFGVLLNGTMPHGRFSFNNPDSPSPGSLDGPLTATEQPIQPIYDNLTAAYTRTSGTASNDGGIGLPPRKNFEWRVRGADFQGAGLGNIQKNSPNQTVSKMADDRNYVYTEEDGTLFHQGNFTQGYATSRVEPNATSDPAVINGGQNLDPQTYSWVTPGFSSIAMDDRPENARIRLRTGTGHQIILDDTNERIYISTVEGNNWIEMDQSGNVDIYAARRVSIHAAMDVNITTDQTFRVNAKEGIHFVSGGDIRMTAAGDTHIKTTGTTHMESTADTNIQSGADMNIKVAGDINLESSGATNVKSGDVLNLQSGDTTNILAGGDIIATGATIELNGPAASPASSAADSDTSEAYFTNRVPEHEPWGRIMMAQGSTDNDSNNAFVLELSYDSPQVGRLELGETITRNSRWHR